MSQITKEITVDVSRKNLLEAIVAKQLDQNSRFLKVTICDNGEKINVPPAAQAVLNVRRADNSAMAFLGTVNSDGTVTVPLTNWTLGLDDVVSCSVSIIGDDEQRLTSTSFAVNVEAAEYMGEDIAQEEAEDVLTQLMSAAAKANAAAFEASLQAYNANTNAGIADKAAKAANEAAERADTATGKAAESANAANAAANRADAAEKAASAAAQSAETAARNANTAADTANAAASAAVATANTAAQEAKEIAAAAGEVANETANAAIKGLSDLQAYLGYTDEDIVGLQVDFKNKMFTRLSGAVGKTSGEDFDGFPMYGGRRRCNVLDDGSITAYYGDKNYTEDGSNGQVMVYQPVFWYRVVPIELEKNTDSNIGYHIRKANYYVCGIPKPGFKRHPAFYDEKGNPVDHILLSAYEGSMWDASEQKYINDNLYTDIAYSAGDLLCSVAGKKPISGLRTGMGTRANFEAMSNNRGKGWHLSTVKSESANQLLMMIELGTMNTQTGIGLGVSYVSDNSAYNCSSLTGSTSELGNKTGQAKETVNEIGGTQRPYATAEKLSVTYRGVENPWGNIWKFVNGINIWGDSHMNGGQIYISDDFNFSEDKHDGNYHGTGFTLPNASGYINAMGYGKEEYDWVLMASETGGAATTALPVGDTVQVTANLYDNRKALFGGTWNLSTAAGGFHWDCHDNGQKNRTIGGRLMYVPTAKA